MGLVSATTLRNRETIFRIVYENRRRDVHGVNGAQALVHATLADKPLYGVRDVEVIAAMRRASHSGGF